jgi:hypothetical protein
MDKSAPGNAAPTAVTPIEAAAFAGICPSAPICERVATTAVWQLVSSDRCVNREADDHERLVHEIAGGPTPIHPGRRFRRKRASLEVRAFYEYELMDTASPVPDALKSKRRAQSEQENQTSEGRPSYLLGCTREFRHPLCFRADRCRMASKVLAQTSWS